MKESDNTFAKKEDLPLFNKIEGMVNPSVEPEAEFRLSGQNLEVFKKLLKGPAWNTELQKLTQTKAKLYSILQWVLAQQV